MKELNNAQTVANSLITSARRVYGVEICCSDAEERELIAAAQAYLDSGAEQLSLFGGEILDQGYLDDKSR